MIVDNATQINPSHSRRTVVPASATAMLDIVAKGLPQTPTDSLDLLCVWLHSKRQELSAKDWPAFVTQCRQHPLLQRLHADPLTHRAYAKLRGYPGDAPLLDLIYSSEDEDLAPQGLEQEARAIFGYTRMSPACRAVRTRRRAIAKWVDHVGARVGKKLRVLSIAAGHLREARLSHACLDSQFEEWVALDQDRESLRMIEGDYGHLGVTPRYGTVRSVLRGGGSHYDFVYAAGLFDYLSYRTAQRLVEAMFRLLRPGGELLVTNFVPEVPDVGYMECMMDWHLIYRTPEEMLDLAALVPADQIERLALSSEEDRNLLFLRLSRRG